MNAHPLRICILYPHLVTELSICSNEKRYSNIVNAEIYAKVMYTNQQMLHSLGPANTIFIFSVPYWWFCLFFFKGDTPIGNALHLQKYCFFIYVICIQLKALTLCSKKGRSYYLSEIIFILTFINLFFLALCQRKNENYQIFPWILFCIVNESVQLYLLLPYIMSDPVWTFKI